MVVVILLYGLASGIFGATSSLIAGHSIWFALAAYAGFGSLGTALAAGLILAHAMRRETTAQSTPSLPLGHSASL
jgi:hypothetical protein